MNVTTSRFDNKEKPSHPCREAILPGALKLERVPALLEPQCEPMQHMAERDAQLEQRHVLANAVERPDREWHERACVVWL